MKRPLFIALSLIAGSVAGHPRGLEAQPQDRAVLLTAPQQDTARTPLDPATVSLSADGRHIAFSSYARLTAADTNQSEDIYVLDRATADITLESVGTGGAYSGSAHPRISGDGRLIVFETMRTAGGGEPRNDVVIRDRSSGVTRIMSRGPKGEAADSWSRTPAISENGTRAAFVSSATNLVEEGDANGAREEVYLFDVPTGRVRRISVADSGQQLSEGASFAPSISADGQRIAFASSADLDGHRELRGPDVNRRGTDARESRRQTNVYVRDLSARRTIRVSVTHTGAAPDEASYHPSVSGDGRFIVFVSEASNLLPDDSNRQADIFLHDLEDRSTTFISRGANRRPANGASANPVISANGRYVAFQSEASNLVCGRPCPPASHDINLVWDVFVFDRWTGTLIRASTDPEGGWMEPSGGVALDRTGSVVAFSSLHPTGGRDLAHDRDLFLRISPSVSPVASGSRR